MQPDDSLHHFTDSETNAILAGLRSLQIHGLPIGYTSDLSPLTNDEIDSLCQSINFNILDRGANATPDSFPPPLENLDIWQLAPNEEGEKSICLVAKDCAIEIPSHQAWKLYSIVPLSTSDRQQLVDGKTISLQCHPRWRQTVFNAFANNLSVVVFQIS